MSPMVNVFIFIFLVIPLVIYVCYWIVNSLRKSDSGIKYMLLGLHLSLVGGIMVVDNNLDFKGFEYLVVLLGLTISLLGMRKIN